MLLEPGPVLTVAPDQPLVEALGQMQEQGIPCAWVVKDRELLGSLLATDGIRLGLAGLIRAGVAVSEGMIPAVTIARAELELWADRPSRVAAWMQASGIRWAAVLDDQSRILGTLSWERVQAARLANCDQVELERQAALNLKEGIEQSIPIGIAAADFSGRQTYINDAFAAMVGWPKAELLGADPPYIYWPPEEIEAITQSFEEGLDLGRPLPGWELTFRRRNGERFPVRILDAPWRDGQGNLIGMIASVQDISAEKQLIQRLSQRQEQAQQREEWIQLATDLAEIGIWEFDVATGVGIWSDSHFRLMGLDPEQGEAAYQTWQDRVHPDDLSWVEAAFQSALDHHTAVDVEYRITYPDGSIHWVANRGQGIYDQSGQAIRMAGVMFDITERKQAELLQESMLAAIPDLIGLMNADGSQVKLLSFGSIKAPNPQADRTPGSPLSAMLPPDACERRLNHIRRAIETQKLQIYRQELEVDGTLQHEEVRVVPCGSDQVVCIVRDVSQQIKKVEQYLKDSEARFRLLTENATDMIMRHSLEGICLYVSPSCQAILGYEPAELIGQEAYQLFHPDDIPRLQQFHRQTLETRKTLTTSYRIRHKDGSYLWVETTTRLLRDPETDQPYEIQSATRDISERMSYQVALQETQAELTYQVEVVNGALTEALEFEALLRSITDRVRASLDEAEILQMAVEELKQGLDLEGCYIGHYQPDEGFYTIDYGCSETYPRPTGRPYPSISRAIPDQLKRLQPVHFCIHYPETGWVTVLIVPIFVKQDEMYGFLSMLRPKKSSFLSGEIRLAEQVANQCAIGIRQAQLYQESQKQVIKLQELNQLKEDFIHTVSHELRTPLTSMKMALTLLGIHKDNPEKVQTYLDILTSEWNRELALVNELLELQAIESGTRAYSLSSLDIQSWLPALVQSFELRCAEHSQMFRLDIDPEINIWVTDQHLLGRILLELLNNACKYTPSDQSIRLTLRPIQTGIQIEVTNTGVTISPEHQTKIFEKFHRLPHLDVFNQGGTGLGLPLVQKVVELLGGEISLHSAANVTTFRIQLPDLAKDPEDPVVAVSPLSTSLAAQTGSEILSRQNIFVGGEGV